MNISVVGSPPQLLIIASEDAFAIVSCGVFLSQDPKPLWLIQRGQFADDGPDASVTTTVTSRTLGPALGSTAAAEGEFASFRVIAQGPNDKANLISNGEQCRGYEVEYGKVPRGMVQTFPLRGMPAPVPIGSAFFVRVVAFQRMELVELIRSFARFHDG